MQAKKETLENHFLKRRFSIHFQKTFTHSEKVFEKWLGKTFSKLFFPIVFVLLVFGFSCGSPEHPEGLAEAGGGTGPKIVFDPLIQPIPEIPFPMDIATILDESSPTGRRLNLPTQSHTVLEQKVRAGMNSLDGFGTFAPIWVRFDAPLDLHTVNDNTVLVIKLLPPNAGAVVPLDLGKGFFPTLFRPDSWWPHDPLANLTNLVMADNNRADLDGDTVEEFIDFYEFETNTLIIRPIMPLEEASRYAVVLLRDIKGLDGEPIRSPFKYINHAMQTNDLQPLVGILAQKGIPLERVAFCWSFTTQSITPDWINISQGLFQGAGPLSYLASTFPPVLKPTNLQLSADYDGNPYTLNSDWFAPLLLLLLPYLGEQGLESALDFRYIDYLVFGTVTSPTFFPRLDFGNPLTNDEIKFDEAKLAGQSPAGSVEATWFLSVPRDEDMGLDGCQSQSHPHGCKDLEEAGAKGADGGYGVAGFDDNGDTFIDDEGEYLAQGSDDVIDPAGDNYNPTDPACQALVASNDPCVPVSALHCTQGNGRLDYNCGADLKPGRAGVDDDNNGIVDDITEFGWSGSDDGVSEDANRNGRLDTPPFPVAVYGHGHGMAAIEGIGFVAPMAQHGLALLAMDAFGHGPLDPFAKLDQVIKDTMRSAGIDLNEICHAGGLSANCQSVFMFLQILNVDLNGDGTVDENDVDGKTIDAIVSGMFTVGLFHVLSKQGRAYDIDGDTYTDSGAVTFTAHIFQTRDCLRQTAIDYMQLVRSVDSAGTRFSLDLNGDTIPEMDGDFNLDGKNDIGGPATGNMRGHFYLGSSLGGINGAINMAVNPRILVGAPVSGAGGLVDVIYRSHQRSATEPIIRQTAGLVVVGDYDGIAGRATLTFNADPASQAIGHLYLPDFGRVQVTNLTNGESRVVTAQCDPPTITTCPAGTAVNFSIGIPADVGDLIQIISLDDAPTNRSTVYAYAKYHGMGVARNTPDFRRFLALGQIIVDRTDPANLAKHYFSNEQGVPLPGYPQKSVLVINTVGDSAVPVSTGGAIGLSAGLWTIPQAQSLIDNGLYFGYIPQEGYIAPLYDPEDVDDDGLECGFEASDPRCLPGDLAPMPVVPVPGTDRVGAIRWHYPSDSGHHAFTLPGQRNNGIDWGAYMINQIGYFFASDGTCVIDDPWELHSAPYIHPGPNGVLDSVRAGDDNIHTVRVLTTLGKNPCDYPFPQITIITTGPNGTLNTTRAGDDILVRWADIYRGP